MTLRLLARVLLASAAIAALVPMSAAGMTLRSSAAAAPAGGMRTLADTLPDSVSLTTTIVDETLGGPIEGAIDAGDIVHDVGTVTNLGVTNGTPRGTVTFTFFPNDSCTAPGVDVGSVAPDDTGFADGSDPQGPLAPGSYSFNAHFVPEDPTLWMEAFSDCEPLYVQGGVGAVDLTVRKDAHPSFTQTYTWTITKSAAEESQSIAAGGTAAFNYTVNVSHDAGTPGDWQVNGTITVANPNAGDVTLSGIDDTVDNGGTCSVDTGGDLIVPAGGTTYRYTCTYTSAPSPAAGTNTVTVRWDDQALGDGSLLAGGSASWQEPFDFGSVAPTIVDGSVDVTDTLRGDLGTVSYTDSPTTSFSYSVPFTGDPAGTSTTHDNTATFTTDTTGTTGSAGTTVTVYVGGDLTVAKTANASFTRAYDWTISKAVDRTLVEQSGGTATFNYTVNAAETGFTDSGWTVDGTITVSNPNDWEDVTVSLNDSLPGCTLASPSVTVPADRSVGVDYSCPLSSGTDGTNTVTATWDKSAFFTPSDSASAGAGFVFGSPTSTIARTVTVTDSSMGSLGALTATDTQPFASGTYAYSRTVNVLGGQCVTYPNTAAITGTGQSAGRSVKVCGTNTGALTMGYWQNKNGQAIIAGANQTALLTYLTGLNPLTDATAPLSAYVTNVIKAASAGGSTMNAMLKAQMLATALDVYFSDPALGGNRIGAAVPIGGVTIDLTHVPPIGDASSAFGGAQHLTVSQILSYAAGQSNAGGSTWYGNVKSTQEPAKDTLDAINNGVALLF